MLTFKLGLLKHLDFTNIDIMKGIDGLARFFYVFPNAVWDARMAGNKV